jgi:hypothetical protein
MNRRRRRTDQDAFVSLSKVGWARSLVGCRISVARATPTGEICHRCRSSPPGRGGSRCAAFWAQGGGKEVQTWGFPSHGGVRTICLWLSRSRILGVTNEIEPALRSIARATARARSPFSADRLGTIVECQASPLPSARIAVSFARKQRSHRTLPRPPGLSSPRGSRERRPLHAALPHKSQRATAASAAFCSLAALTDDQHSRTISRSWFLPVATPGRSGRDRPVTDCETFA